MWVAGMAPGAHSLALADAPSFSRRAQPGAVLGSCIPGFVNGIDCSVAIDTCTRAPADVGLFACNVLPYRTDDVNKYYTFGREIGRGSYGVVRECHRKGTGEIFACKVIQKAQLKTVQDRKVVAREIGLMEMVKGHPAVVQLEGVFEDDNEVVIVMELCNGGELYHQILSNGRFPEAEAAAVFAQIVDAIAHCHSKGVVHRDLKPENILFHHRPVLGLAPPEQFTVELKLADFGLGTWLAPGQGASARIGSLMYEAPEVVCGSEYNSQADMWSLGIILYALLSGTLPFLDPDQHKLAKKICAGTFELRTGPWPFISDEAKGLIRSLIVVDPNKRLTAEEALCSPWLLKNLSAPASPRTPPAVDSHRSGTPSEASFHSSPGSLQQEPPQKEGGSSSPQSPVTPLLPSSPRGNKREILSDDACAMSPHKSSTGAASPFTSRLEAAALSRQDSYASALSSHSNRSSGSRQLGDAKSLASPRSKRVRRRWRHGEQTCCMPFLDFRFWFGHDEADFREDEAEPSRAGSPTNRKPLQFQKLQPDVPEVVQGAPLAYSGPAAVSVKAHGSAKGGYHHVGEDGRTWNRRSTRRLKRFFSGGRRTTVRL